MKKKIFGGILAVAIAAVAAVNVNINNEAGDALSALSLANVEAVADGESGGGPICYWKVIDCPGLGTGDYEACLSNGDGKECACGAVTRDC